MAGSTREAHSFCACVRIDYVRLALRQRVKHHVGEKGEGPKQRGADDKVMQNRTGSQPLKDILEQSQRIGYEIPTVPAQEAADVNALAAQSDHQRGETPARDPPRTWFMLASPTRKQKWRKYHREANGRNETRDDKLATTQQRIEDVNLQRQNHDEEGKQKGQNSVAIQWEWTLLVNLRRTFVCAVCIPRQFALRKLIAAVTRSTTGRRILFASPKWVANIGTL